MLSDELLMSLCRALTDTVRSGLSLSEAFDTLSRSPRYGRVIAGAAKLTAGGSSLHEALKAQNSFPPVFIALVRAGEEGGNVAEFLALYADCLEVRVEFRRRVGRALIYPAFTVTLAGALLLVVMFKLLPAIMGPLFTAGIAVPPWILRLNGLAGSLSQNWPPAVIAACVLALALRTLLRSGPGRKLRALAGHWLPVFSFATGEGRAYYIYTIMGLLLKAGVPLGSMMDVLLQFSQDDPVDRRRFARASALFSEGKSFSESLRAWTPRDDRQSLEIAEKAGRLDGTLLQLGKLHYDRHMHRLKLLVTGIKISAMIAIALFTFGSVVLLMRPIRSVLAGAQAVSPGPQVLTAPSGLTPAPAGGSGVFQLPNSSVISDPTALFNKASGSRVMELMKKSAAQGDTGASGAPRQEGAKPKKKMLAPAPRMKSVKFQRIAPTTIKPTEPE